jgi:hypothetical protein
MTDFAIMDLNGNGDNKLNPSESAYLDIRVKNNVNAAINVSSVVLSTTNSYVTIDKGTATIGNLSSGSTTILTKGVSNYSDSLLYSSYLSQAFKFTISNTCPVGTNIPFTVTFTDSWGNMWTDTLTITVI